MELKLHEEVIKDALEEPSVLEDMGNDTVPKDTYGEWNNLDDEPYVATTTRRLSQTEFYHHPVMRKAKSDILLAGILIYIGCASTILLNMFWAQRLFSLDLLLILGLGLGVHLRRSRGCAVALSIYVIINMLYMWFVVDRHYSGWLLIWAAYASVKGTFAFQEAWKEYDTSGSYPGV